MRLANLSDERRLYLLNSLPAHLARSSKLDRFIDLLSTFAFLRAKQLEFGIHALIEDHALSETPGNALATIQRTLLLSSHILSNHPNQLAAQLIGHLNPIEGSAAARLLTEAAEWDDATWLRPITGSLADRDSFLARTIDSRARSVDAIVIAPNGDEIISGSSDGLITAWDLSDGSLIYSLDGFQHQVGSLALSPNGQFVLLQRQMNWPPGISCASIYLLENC